jgi:hypothetical protein
MGILEATVGRWSRDHKFSKREVLLTILYLWLAIEAAYSGSLDLAGRQDQYEAWVSDLASSPVPVPDGFIKT